MTTTTPGCSGGNKYNTSTGALCVNNAVTTSIPGCGNKTTGFSTASGTSCAGNVASAAATTGPYNFGTTTLKNGSKGNAVMELQRFLNANLNLGLALDGKIGPKTIAVIKKWQKANGLVADGLIGAKTKALMNSMAQ
jgi:peptidoglycan hydrolase-like protein with peptidoglycan-binding domain